MRSFEQLMAGAFSSQRLRGLLRAGLCAWTGSQGSSVVSALPFVLTPSCSDSLSFFGMPKCP